MLCNHSQVKIKAFQALKICALVAMTEDINRHPKVSIDNSHSRGCLLLASMFVLPTVVSKVPVTLNIHKYYHNMLGNIKQVLAVCEVLVLTLAVVKILMGWMV